MGSWGGAYRATTADGSKIAAELDKAHAARGGVVPQEHAYMQCMATHLRRTSSSPSVRALTRATGRANLMLNSPSMVSLAIFTISTADLSRYSSLVGSVTAAYRYYTSASKNDA